LTKHIGCDIIVNEVAKKTTVDKNVKEVWILSFEYNDEIYETRKAAEKARMADYEVQVQRIIEEHELDYLDVEPENRWKIDVLIDYELDLPEIEEIEEENVED